MLFQFSYENLIIKTWKQQNLNEEEKIEKEFSSYIVFNVIHGAIKIFSV